MRGKYRNKRDARLANRNPTHAAVSLSAILALVDLTKLNLALLDSDTIYSEEWKQIDEQATAAATEYLASNWPAIIDEWADESDEDGDVHIYLSAYLRFRSADWFGPDASKGVCEVIDRFFTEDEYSCYG